MWKREIVILSVLLFLTAFVVEAQDKGTRGVASFGVTNSSWLGLLMTFGGGYEFTEDAYPNFVGTAMLDIESFEIVNFGIFGKVQQSNNVNRPIEWHVGPGIFHNWYFLHKVGIPQKDIYFRTSFWVPVLPTVKGGHFQLGLIIDFK